jgi:hypothetical protein
MTAMDPRILHATTGVGETTLLQIKRGDTAVIVVAATVLGIGVGLAVPAVAQWARETPWVPLPGVLRVLEWVASHAGGWVLAVAGTGIAAHQTKLKVTARDISFISGDKVQRFARAQVAVAVMDGAYLELRDERDVNVAREKLDLPRDEVVRALRGHGWSVQD